MGYRTSDTRVDIKRRGTRRKIFPSRSPAPFKTLAAKLNHKQIAASTRRFILPLLLTFGMVVVGLVCFPNRATAMEALYENMQGQLTTPGAIGAATKDAVAITAASTARAAQITKPLGSMAELRLSFRLLWSMILGSSIGKERAQSHRVAGVRTLALVALGSTAFTLCSMYGFSGAGSVAKYDPSRMASSVATGVGFVGAGVITTTANPTTEPSDEASMSKSIADIDDDDDCQLSLSTTATSTKITHACNAAVHGLTTAAAIWLSAAIGVLCGAGMYVTSTSTAVLTLAILRLGGQRKMYHYQGQDVHEMLRELNDRKNARSLLIRKSEHSKTTSRKRKTSSNSLSNTRIHMEPSREDNCVFMEHSNIDDDKHKTLRWVQNNTEDGKNMQVTQWLESGLSPNEDGESGTPSSSDFLAP